MKKKIIFMIINMNVGGTEKALLNMMSEIPKEKFDITILMLEKEGGYLEFIPSEVHIEYLEGYEKIKDIIKKPPLKISLGFLKKGKMIKAFNIILFHLISKIMKERSIYFKYVLYNYPVNNNVYDAAVAYAGPMDFISYFVVHKIKAKTKIQWIHFDVTKVGFNPFFSSKVYKMFDKIFVVSNEGKNKLVKIIPNLKDKAEVFTNIVSQKLICNQSKEGKGFNDSFDGIRILTVGRLSYEKGQDLAICTLARLIKAGYNVKWYCVGDGNSRIEYQKLVEAYNVKNNFVFLGVDPNPYSYMKQCDIYVQPSRHEGFCITLAEAKCLKKPIVTTNFTGAQEQIKDGKTGLIVNVDEQEIYNAVVQLINKIDVRNQLVANLTEEEVDTTNNIKKVLSVI